MDRDRVHPLHVATFVVVTLAAIFAFVAMQVAFEARDAAYSANHWPSDDDSYAIQELQDALVRAGVIRDPWDVGDDHQELGGPWARCLTAEERDAMDLDEDDVELPPACETAEVIRVEECDETVPEIDPAGDEVEIELCELSYRIEGMRHVDLRLVHPEDVEASADRWYLAQGDDGVDRLARGQGDTFIHIVGEGWHRADTW